MIVNEDTITVDKRSINLCIILLQHAKSHLRDMPNYRIGEFNPIELTLALVIERLEQERNR